MRDLLGEPIDVAEDSAAGLTVPVLLPLALDAPYDYLALEGEELAPGDFVLVPIGPRKEVGVVWPREAQAKRVDPKKLKSIIERFDIPRLPAISLRFAEW